MDRRKLKKALVAVAVVVLLASVIALGYTQPCWIRVSVHNPNGQILSVGVIIDKALATEVSLIGEIDPNQTSVFGPWSMRAGAHSVGIFWGPAGYPPGGAGQSGVSDCHIGLLKVRTIEFQLPPYE